MKLIVRYTATFEKIIEVESPEQLTGSMSSHSDPPTTDDILADLSEYYCDDCNDIDPASGEYQDSTFEVECVEFYES